VSDIANLVTDAFDRYVEGKEEERVPDGFWHPSSISSRCARKSIYTIRGVPKTDVRSKQSSRTLYLGKVIHVELQSAVSLSPFVKHAYHETAIFDDNDGITVPTVGSGDSITIQPDEDAEVEEYKSKSSNMMRSKTQIEALPDPEHVIQVKTYMRAVRRRGFQDEDGVQHDAIPNLTMGRIIYYGKDTSQIVECLIQYNPEIDDQILDARLAYLEAYREDGQALPPRLPLVVKHPKGKAAFTEFDWLCKVCDWNHLCYHEDPDEIPLYKEFTGDNPFDQGG
jgi:hypothetical protein